MDDDFVGDDSDVASVRDMWLIWTADLLQRGFFLSSSTAPVKKLHCDHDAISERIHLKWLSAKLFNKISCPSKPALLEICPLKFVFILVLSDALFKCMQRMGALSSLLYLFCKWREINMPYKYLSPQHFISPLVIERVQVSVEEEYFLINFMLWVNTQHFLSRWN